MGLKKILDTTLDQYLREKNSPTKGNEFGSWFRSEVKETIAALIDRDDLIVKSSVGEGNWADVPWIGIFNPIITSSATTGFYVVYLWAADCSSVFLCQGQGVTSIRNEFRGSKGAGEKIEAELLNRAELMRLRVPEFTQNFSKGPVTLGGKTQLAKDYELAPAWFKEYKKGNLPDEEQLVLDLQEAVRLYDLLNERGGTDNLETLMTSEEVTPTEVTEQRRLRLHRQFERNNGISKKVKKAKGYACEGCGFDFKEVYGERGEGYIEAHHLVPVATLGDGEARTMNIEKDFAVLCANCHRMVHNGKEILSLDELRSLPGVATLRDRLETK